MVVRAHRVVAAEPETVWRLVGDPNQLPRWWPRAVRVEGVTGREFTIVMTSARGREVRADQRVVASDRGRRRVWTLEVEGSPFASVFAASETTVLVAPADGGTEVRLELRQKLRGAARLGLLLVRRGSKRQLHEALDAVVAELAPAPAP